MGRNAANSSVLSASKFSTGKGWFGEDFFYTGFVKWSNMVVLFLFFFFCFGWTFDTNLEFKITAPILPQNESSGPCYLPVPLFPLQMVSHEHPMKTSPLQLCFSKVPAGEGDAPAWTEAGHITWGAAEASPALGEEAWAKTNIPTCLAKTCFLPTWCKNTGGLTQAVDFGWNQMVGFRDIHWRRTIKRTKPAHKANLTLSTSSSKYMSLGKQPTSNSWV